MREATTPAEAGPRGRLDRAAPGPGGRPGPGRRFGGLVAALSAGLPPSAGVGLTSAAAPRAGASIASAPCVSRILIGGGPGLAEARIRIADGAGGSAEIRLAAVGGGREIAAQVLTAAVGSRDTLAGVMNELRLRLRRRGISLTDAEGGDSPVARRGAGGRGR